MHLALRATLKAVAHLALRTALKAAVHLALIWTMVQGIQYPTLLLYAQSQVMSRNLSRTKCPSGFFYNGVIGYDMSYIIPQDVSY